MTNETEVALALVLLALVAAVAVVLDICVSLDDASGHDEALKREGYADRQWRGAE
jgi:hypothetical protein